MLGMPMIGVDGEVYRVQKLDAGQWKTLETEYEYNMLVDDLIDEA